jgi:predicted nucleotidyltransferase
LTNQEIETIKEVIGNFFEEPVIYLFGSRVSSDKKGGDIDLFIICKNPSYEAKLKSASKLELLLNKPVDIVLHKDFNKEIEKEALRGVRL